VRTPFGHAIAWHDSFRGVSTLSPIGEYETDAPVDRAATLGERMNLPVLALADLRPGAGEAVLVSAAELRAMRAARLARIAAFNAARADEDLGWIAADVARAAPRRPRPLGQTVVYRGMRYTFRD